MRNQRDQIIERPTGSYSLREVLAQVSDQDADLVIGGPKAIGAGGLRPPPIPKRPDPVATDEPDAGGPSSATHAAYVAAGAGVCIAAVVAASMLMAPNSPIPARGGSKVAALPADPADLRSNTIASGPLVSTLVSLSKTVLAGQSQSAPPGTAPPPGERGHAPLLALADIIQLRASNVVADSAGAEVSWRIEFAAQGIELPNARIVVEGLPPTAKLNHGWLRTDGRWSLATGELPGLTVTVPSSFVRSQLTVILANDGDHEIARTEAVIEPVPKPEAVMHAEKAGNPLADRFDAFVENWKRTKGREKLTQSERTALFSQFQSIADDPVASKR